MLRDDDRFTGADNELALRGLGGGAAESRGLIDPTEAAPFEAFNTGGSAAALFVADHASRRIPHALDQLGLADWVLERHVAYDIGSGVLTQMLASQLDAPAVLAGYSRLVIDLNRKLDHPSAFPEHSDGIGVPGNLGLSSEAKAARAEALFWPYHVEVERQLDTLCSRGASPALISIHSCTPVFDRLIRPWQVGVLWDDDPAIARPLFAALQEAGVRVGDNEPYSGRWGHAFTTDHHGKQRGLPHVGIEVRQDLIDHPAGVQDWAAILGPALAGVLASLKLDA